MSFTPSRLARARRSTGPSRPFTWVWATSWSADGRRACALLRAGHAHRRQPRTVPAADRPITADCDQQAWRKRRRSSPLRIRVSRLRRTALQSRASGIPRLFHARSSDGLAWMTQLIRFAVDESTTRRSGGETVLSRVAELMFVERRASPYRHAAEAARGWLSGLRDPQVGAALVFMHNIGTCGAACAGVSASATLDEATSAGTNMRSHCPSASIRFRCRAAVFAAARH